ncbi:MAG: ABC-F family ATP-binding cassette domain-containing protein [Phycisphaerales bacterium]|nr:ABC-F family ATP-binding cassette domain-containing protein [Phycisphaerales bacterium]
MPLATLTNIEKSFGDRVLLDRANLNIEKGERIGLIGANGSGKTTIFRLLVGQMQAEAGVAAVSRSTTVGYLSQDPVLDPANSVMDEAELAFAELHDLSHRLRDLEHAMAEVVGEELDKVLHQYQTVQHEFELAGGYAWRHRLEATLEGVGLLSSTWEQNVSTLSGGQRSRLALAKLLISPPDVLLLDEPTNHLDLAAIEWLEKYLADFRGAVVLISHDRFLLDRLATRIVWLTQCRLQSYPGNYSAFVQQRQLQELTQERQYAQQRADIEKQQEYIRRFKAGQRARQAAGREKRLDRLLRSDAVVKQVAAGRHIHLSLETEKRAGDQVLTVRELSKQYDDRRLWQNIGFQLVRGQRVGIIGPNGSGKTTLLEVLIGRRDADEGLIKWGANLQIGYYDQKLEDFDPEQSILQTVAEDRPTMREQELREALAVMLFSGDDVDKPMGLLSGGERARVALAQLLLDRPNVLLLDEPTNHLDIASCEALENALRQFNGTLLCVSHDRYFLNRTADRLLILQPPGIVDFDGTYSQWAARQQSPPADKPAPAKSFAAKPAATKPTVSKPTATKPASNRKSQPVVAKSQRKDNPYLRPFGRLSMAELEQRISDTEVAISEAQSQLADAEVFKNPARAREVQDSYDTLSQQLEQLETEYYDREQ